MKKIILIALIAGIVVFGLIQLIPVNRSNPPTTQEPKWSSPQARELVKSACFDCHSNETTWPWYSYVAPVSWLISHDVAEGRDQFNFSNWDTNQGELEEMVKEISRGKMPPPTYTIMHPNAKLSDQQKQALIDALTSSIQQ